MAGNPTAKEINDSPGPEMPAPIVILPESFFRSSGQESSGSSVIQQGIQSTHIFNLEITLEKIRFIAIVI